MIKYTTQTEICRFRKYKNCCVIFSVSVGLRTMAVENQDDTFENFKSNFFSFESVLSSDTTDPDKNFFNDKLQQIDSLYFSVESLVHI